MQEVRWRHPVKGSSRGPTLVGQWDTARHPPDKDTTIKSPWISIDGANCPLFSPPEAPNSDSTYVGGGPCHQDECFVPKEVSAKQK